MPLRQLAELRGVGRPQVRLIRMQLCGKLVWVDSPRPVDENAGLARSAADAESHQETRSRCPPRTPRVMAAAVRATVGYRLIGGSTSRRVRGRQVYGDLQITFLDVLQLTRYHKNIIDNECSAVSSLRQATREL